MSVTSIIHCFNNQIETLAKLASKMGLKATIFENLGVQISGDYAIHTEFTQLFVNNTDFHILYDDSLGPQYRFNYYHHKLDKNLNLNHNNNLTLTSSRTATWMAQHYNFPAPINSGVKPIIAIISLGGGYKIADLQYYWQTICGMTTYPTVYNVAVGQTSVPTMSNPPNGADEENTLDLEITGAISQYSTLLFISAPNSLTGFYNAIATAINGVLINNVKYIPTIVSCSWGMSELNWGTSNLNTFNSLFALGASKGITFLVASGDNGSTDGISPRINSVDFPGSSPYVISCGGTSLNTSGVETAWSYNKTYKWGGGGGISSIFNALSFQQPYLALPSSTLPPRSKPIPSGYKVKRAVPDISLNADPLSGWTIYVNGTIYTNAFGGTSCVAPLMAGFIALLKLNFTPLSCGNVLYNLYSTASRTSCFKDITTGSNDNIVGSTGIWNSGVGFDYVTGMGSINGTNLANAIKNLSLTLLIKNLNLASIAEDKIHK